MIEFTHDFDIKSLNKENELLEHGILLTTKFDIDEPGIYCLVGGNGTGKSTVIKNISKIKRPVPKSFIDQPIYIFNLNSLLGKNADKNTDLDNDVLEAVTYYYSQTISEGERLLINIKFYLDNIKSGIICIDEVDSGLSDDRCILAANYINEFYKKHPDSIIIIASNHFSLYNNINNPIYISMKDGKRINVDNYEEWINVITEIGKSKDISNASKRLFGGC